MKLTAKQEKFCQGVADGLTLSDAYRAAYDCSRTTDKSVCEGAARLMADTKVSARTAELRASLAEKRLWSREKSAEALVKVVE
jgi:phage terminase small subunit